jgi:S-adenosylmethionine synthetase
MHSMTLLSSESVAAGHPDKVCDLISDTFVDAMIKRDPEARVACEVMLTNGKVIVSGEFAAQPGVFEEVQREAEGLVRGALRAAGYSSAEFDIDPEACEVELRLNEQSREIAWAVQRSGFIGAGDQGMMFGYATLETAALMPRALDVAQTIVRHAEQQKAVGDSPLRADGKCQVTIGEGRFGPDTLLAVVLSWQHMADAGLDRVREYLHGRVIEPALEEADVVGRREARYHVNPAGAWTIGGPRADCGLTGRKIVVDTYGGAAPHGGGAFSGKDPTKVDRSGAYMARYLARHVVASGLSDRCLVQLAYAIGQADPVSVMVDTRGGGKVSDQVIARALQKLFDLTPAGIITELDLRRPIYADTASGGHFGASRDPGVYLWETQPRSADVIVAVTDVLRGDGRRRSRTRPSR